MTQTLAITAESRAETGKGAARTARRAGRIPAVIYGHGREPESLSVSAMEFGKLLQGVTGGSSVIELEVGGKKVQTLLREVQRHPMNRTVTHIDFYEIHAGEVITVGVPIHLIGIPEGVQNSGGTLDIGDQPVTAHQRHRRSERQDPGRRDHDDLWCDAAAS